MRTVFDENKNFARKVTKIVKMLVRIVALEGLQPMVTEAIPNGDNSHGCSEETKRRVEILYSTVMVL